MNIEEPEFNRPEQQEVSSAETEAEPMSPEAAEQMLNDAAVYFEELKGAVEEKLSELETLKQDPDTNGYGIAELQIEIQELQEQISESEELLGGSEFFIRDIKE